MIMYREAAIVKPPTTVPTGTGLGRFAVTRYRRLTQGTDEQVPSWRLLYFLSTVTASRLCADVSSDFMPYRSVPCSRTGEGVSNLVKHCVSNLSFVVELD